MTPDDAQTLQFDTAVLENAGGVDAVAGSACRTCACPLLDEYFDVNGAPVCARCRELFEQHAQPVRGLMPLARATLFGFAAAIAGAVLYYAVLRITNLEIGLVAVAIGFMVGYGVRKGTRGRGGRAVQVIALVLTYWSVGLAYLPLTMGQQPDAKDAAAPSVTAEARPTAAGPVFSFPVAVMVLLALSFALPVMVIIGTLPGGLLSAAIIGFGMHQAWRMTAAPQLTITGPLRVGTAQLSAT
jgi:hypothetical protein